MNPLTSYDYNPAYRRTVYTENFVRHDWLEDSPDVSVVLCFVLAVGLVIQVEDPA
jgi:hypothetical protein